MTEQSYSYIEILQQIHAILGRKVHVFVFTHNDQMEWILAAILVGLLLAGESADLPPMAEGLPGGESVVFWVGKDMAGDDPQFRGTSFILRERDFERGGRRETGVLFFMAGHALTTITVHDN